MELVRDLRTGQHALCIEIPTTSGLRLDRTVRKPREVGFLAKATLMNAESDATGIPGTRVFCVLRGDC